MKRLHLRTLLGSAVLLTVPVAGASAAEHSPMHHAPSAVRADAHATLRSGLFISPSIVNVGQRVTFSIVAPIPSAVLVSFRSMHHAFAGTAFYQPASRSYLESVYLIPRVHGTERAQVTVAVTPHRTGRTYRLYGQFFIRGESMAMDGIPQNNGGDHDGDNNGNPSDGDGGQ